MNCRYIADIVIPAVTENIIYVRIEVMGFRQPVHRMFQVDASKVSTDSGRYVLRGGAMIEPLAMAVHGVKQMGDA